MKLLKSIFITILVATTMLVKAQVNPKNGIWRGTFKLAGGQLAPFNFELKGNTVFLLNGAERFELNGVSQRNDSLFIPIDIYDAVLSAKILNGKTLTGVFRKFNTTRQDNGIEFKAEYGKSFRFFEKPEPAGVSLQGNWDVVIGEGNNKVVGVFEQFGSKLTGTFLSTTGDYRYLEGNVTGNEFYLSAFSGSSPSWQMLA